MTVDSEDLREILRLFPLYQIRMIVDERNISKKSNDPEELIDALVQDAWAEDEYDELIERLQTIEEEGRPLGYYICEIDQSPSINKVEKELSHDQAKFDDDGHIEEGGYQIHETSNTELSGTRWRIDIEREFNFRTGEVESTENVKPVDFELDLNDMKVFIDTNQYGKATSVHSKLKNVGLEFEDIGHRNLNPDDANQKVRKFVESMEDSLK
jgi:hypothetical protein